MSKTKLKVAQFIGASILGVVGTTAAWLGFKYFDGVYKDEQQMAAAAAKGTLAPDKEIGKFASNEASMVAGLERVGVDPQLAKQFTSAYQVAASDKNEKGTNGISYLAVSKGPAEMWAQVIHNTKGGPTSMLQNTLCYAVDGKVKYEMKPLPVEGKFQVVESQSFIPGGCDNRLTYEQGKYKVNKITVSPS